MAAPKDLSVAEIQKFMLDNGCKVTNHALVKHFKRFLTNPATQTEARKKFKTYVNMLATIKNENNQKYLILRKKYLSECPSEETAQRALAAADAIPDSPGGGSLLSETGLSASPFRQPPPYKPPPEVTSPKADTTMPAPTTGAKVEKENVDNYRECVNEFVRKVDPARLVKQQLDENEEEVAGIISGTAIGDAKVSHPTSVSRENSLESGENKENIPRFSFSSGTSGASIEDSSGEKISSSDGDVADNPISVKEATRKFNRMASEEEAKVISPPGKKKQDNQYVEEKISPEVLLAHPKAKEWIVSMAKANYHELAKLANEFPELVKLQDPSTGYTALHWAAKHGNEDVVKLIAGTHKGHVNARTNGGYTPLHLAMQFGRENIFELLCNVYKANRDLMDCSGNKPLDYLKQHTSVSLSTYSSEYFDLINMPYSSEILNNNNLGRNIAGGGTISGPLTRIKKRSHLRYATISTAAGGSPVARSQSMMTTGKLMRNSKKTPAKSLFFQTVDDSFIPYVPIETTNSAAIKVPKSSNNNNGEPIKSPSNDRDRATSSDSGQDENIASYRGSASTNDNFGTLSKARRKESFLRKTLRAAAASNKHNHDVVTNNAITE